MTQKPPDYPKDQRRALDAFVKLTRAANAVSARAQRFTAHGLTISQFGVLEALYHLGTLSQNQLAEKILKTSGNMTLVLDNLDKRGLISRNRDREDRRIVRVSLSDRGRLLIGEIFPDHAADIAGAMDALTADEQKVLADLCRKLSNNKAE